MTQKQRKQNPSEQRAEDRFNAAWARLIAAGVVDPNYYAVQPRQARYRDACTPLQHAEVDMTRGSITRQGPASDGSHAHTMRMYMVQRGW